jgi:hypothetical protein
MQVDTAASAWPATAKTARSARTVSKHQRASGERERASGERERASGDNPNKRAEPLPSGNSAAEDMQAQAVASPDMRRAQLASPLALAHECSEGAARREGRPASEMPKHAAGFVVVREREYR